MDELEMTPKTLPPEALRLELPPVVAGHESPLVAKKVGSFYLSVAAMFEAWVARSENYHTQRCYRRDVLSFIEFLQIRWPEDSRQLLKTGVQDVRDWRSFMADEQDFAPKTLNRRISSLSGFFQFMREAAADAKLPIIVQNPAHKDFIKRTIRVAPLCGFERKAVLTGSRTAVRAGRGRRRPCFCGPVTQPLRPQ
ncbi:MAG: site-specific integrase [bacterium]|nr:site-specific integrase [bacterium]